MQISKWDNIRGHTKIMNHFFFYTRIEGKIQFTCLFREGFNHFIRIPSFDLRVCLVLDESKIEKHFSSNISSKNTCFIVFLTRTRLKRYIKSSTWESIKPYL